MTIAEFVMVLLPWAGTYIATSAVAFGGYKLAFLSGAALYLNGDQLDMAAAVKRANDKWLIPYCLFMTVAIDAAALAAGSRLIFVLVGNAVVWVIYLLGYCVLERRIDGGRALSRRQAFDQFMLWGLVALCGALYLLVAQVFPRP